MTPQKGTLMFNLTQGGQNLAERNYLLRTERKKGEME